MFFRRQKKPLSSTERALAKISIVPWEAIGPSIMVVLWVAVIGMLLHAL
jgi:hypothetical protein